MGLSPLDKSHWIETDNHLPIYHRHKLDIRQSLGDRVFMATRASRPAQQELHQRLLRHLVEDQPELYRLDKHHLNFLPGHLSLPVNSGQPLWDCSLWIADDLVIMQEIAGRYCLTAASLCSPSHWRLEEKFEKPMTEIHDPIPGFHTELTPKVDRFFKHLRESRPVVRYNWSLQACERLCLRPEYDDPSVTADSPLYYRTERQSLSRLPNTGAIAFTIRVYLHPLEMLMQVPGALSAMLTAIDKMPAALSRYKGFDRLAPSLARYRAMNAGSQASDS
jgi:hypothetical protein